MTTASNTGPVRRIGKVWRSQATTEGAGVHLQRAFGFREVPQLDPFLLLDDFKSEDPEDYKRGFPWHPHRGIKTITYILDGEVEHGDSLGNSGLIKPGDVQWMTAGSGIIHQEMPRGDRRGQVWGFQLWANLPASDKMMDPRYRDVEAAQIPVVQTTEQESVRFMLVSGKPLKEPVAWHGPIVMNTQEELRTAIEEYRQGTFLRHAGR